MKYLDKIIKERRGLLSSLELHAHLAENPHKWVGFECFLGADGERQWKVLVLSDRDDPLVVVSVRIKARIYKRLDPARAFFEKCHPGADIFELPLVPGRTAPVSHPAPRGNSKKSR